MSSESRLPSVHMERVKEFVNTGKRLDGRSLGEYREFEVELGISKKAEGSVRVRLGKTEVYAGVKMALMTPYPDSPDEGSMSVTMELHPMASNEFDIGKPGIESVEMARVVDRGIRESGFVDFKGLCIKEGEKAYQVMVDIISINDDGNLLDVAGLAGLIAIGNARMPVYNEETGKIEHELTNKKLPLNKDALSFNMTFHKLGNEVLADVNSEEESMSDFRLSISMGEADKKPRISAMQKGKRGVINQSDLDKILTLAEKTWEQLFPQVKKWVFN